MVNLLCCFPNNQVDLTDVLQEQHNSTTEEDGCPTVAGVANSAFTVSQNDMQESLGAQVDEVCLIELESIGNTRGDSLFEDTSSTAWDESISHASDATVLHQRGTLQVAVSLPLHTTHVGPHVSYLFSYQLVKMSGYQSRYS